jgi:HK97 family phage major capsid protein
MPTDIADARELRRQRADVIEQMNGIVAAAEGRSLTPEEQERYDRLHTIQEGIDQTRRRVEQLDALNAELDASQGTIAARRDTPGAPLVGRDGDGLGGAPERAQFLGFQAAGQTVFNRQPAGRHAMELRLQEQYGEGIFGTKTLAAISTVSYRDAWRTYLRKGQGGCTHAELRTLSEGIDTAGGYLVPEDFMNSILQKEPTPTRVSGRVRALQTSRDRLTMPRVNYATDDIYTTGIRVVWSGEQPATASVSRVTDPVFGQFAIDIQTAMMSLPISLDFLEDAAFPVVSWASGKFSETIDLLRDDRILNGTGVLQPHGILENPGTTGEPAITVSGSAATYLPDGLQSIVWDVPEQYEDDAVWVFNKSSTGKLIAQMKDSSNRYLWQPFEQSGLVGDGRAIRANLLGFPVVFSAFMPNVTNNTFPIIFGDLGGYYRVDRVGLSIQVLRELYAETNQALLLGRIRFGGDVAEPWDLRIGKVST